MSDPVRERLQGALGAAYRIERELGGGGMSRVFVADEVALQRAVVVKLLAPELAQSLSADRFRREVLVAARLQHPHVVPLLAAGEADGLLYYTMPLVEGESLRARLARTGPMPVAEVVRVLRTVADALAYAHARGVVHRDIKPDNILLGAGHALVTDFGIAKALTEAGAQATTLTMQGLALGTPAYMAPEQAAGSAAADHRTDLYALGATAYEMLAGESPFGGRTAAAMLVAHATERAAPLAERRPDTPPALAALVMRCLEKDPDLRPGSAADFLAALEQAVTPVPGTPTVVAAPAAPARGRRPTWLWPALIGGVVLLGVGAEVLAVRARRAPAVPASAATILVAPFQEGTGDTALARVGRELALLVGANLDQVGPIRAVDRIASGARFRGTFTEAEALRAAHELGAGSVIVGTLARAGNAVRLDARLLPADGGAALASFGATAHPDSLIALTDAATFDLLRQLWRGRDAPTPSLAAVTTRSVPALRAFLEGERLFAAGDFVEASHAYQRAIDADSTFWFAYGRYNYARFWILLPQDRRYDSVFRAHAELLPERERLFLEVARMGSTDSAGRMLETWRRLVDRYPDYWPGIFDLADRLTHGGGRYWGTTADEPLRLYERVLQLNPGFLPAVQHWVMSGMSVDSARVLQSIARVAPLVPNLEQAETVLAQSIDTTSDDLASWRRAMPAEATSSASSRPGGDGSGVDHRIMSFGASLLGFPRAQRAMLEQFRTELPGQENELLFLRAEALTWAVSGRFDSARAVARRYARGAGDTASVEPYRYAALGYALGLVTAEGLAAERAAVRTAALAGQTRALVELAWLDGLAAASAGDTAGVRKALAAAEASGDPAWAFVSATLPVLARLQAEPAAADSLAKVEMARIALPAPLDGWRVAVSYPIQRLLVARALATRGDTATALRLLAFVDDFPAAVGTALVESPIRGFAMLERARLYEALGDRDRAIHNYRLALRRWGRAEEAAPALAPFVRQAEEGYARVTGVSETQRR